MARSGDEDVELTQVQNTRVLTESQYKDTDIRRISENKTRVEFLKAIEKAGLLLLDGAVAGWTREEFTDEDERLVVWFKYRVTGWCKEKEV